MAERKGKTFVKNGEDGPIERVAYTPADEVKLAFEGFVEKKTTTKASADKTPAGEKAEKTAPEKPAAAGR